MDETLNIIVHQGQEPEKHVEEKKTQMEMELKIAWVWVQAKNRQGRGERRGLADAG